MRREGAGVGRPVARALAGPVPTITYVQPDGSSLSVRVAPGVSLMEAAVRAGVPGIDAKCRGSCACVTCHIHLDPAWRSLLPPQSAMEESMLDFTDGVDAGSRLACQVRVTDACDGMIVRVPAIQRTLGL
jgi:2Fe-2S ferredoxin